jgi:hypothetical protein
MILQSGKKGKKILRRWGKCFFSSFFEDKDKIAFPHLGYPEIWGSASAK